MADTRLQVDDAAGITISVFDGSDKTAGPEPILDVSRYGESQITQTSPDAWKIAFAKSPDLKCTVTQLPNGDYGEQRLDIEFRNEGTDAINTDFPLPYTSWASDPKSIAKRATEYMLITGRKEAIVGGIGGMLCHDPGGVFNQTKFVTVPAGDGKHYIAALARIIDGSPELQPGQKVLYRLHIHSAPGSRNDALKEIYRVRGAYVANVGGYDYSKYDEMPWVKDILSIWINWAWDKDVMDPRTGKYNLTESLKEAEKLFGGYDVYMFWPFWPRAGFDERLQYDHYKDFPGGIDGLKAEIAKVHELGTKVILGYCFWSEGDRLGWDKPEVQQKSFSELVDLACELNADGAIMDCMSTTPADILKGAKERGHNLLPYNEGDPSWEESQTNLLGRIHDGASMFRFSLKKYLIPHHPVFRVTWPGTLGRSMRNDIILSFFNGHGVEINTMWPHRHPMSRNEWPILARMLDIMRTNRANFLSTDWEPLVETLNTAVWANKWPADSGTLYTLCGTDPNGHRGDLLRLPRRDDVHYVDLWRYRPIEPRVDGDFHVLPYSVDPYTPGVGMSLGTGDYSPGCIAVLPKALNVGKKLEMLSVKTSREGTVEIWLDSIQPDSEPFRSPIKDKLDVDLYQTFGHTNDAIIVRLLDGNGQLIDVVALPEESVRFFRVDKPARTEPVDPKNPPKGMVRITGGKFQYSITQGQPVWQPTWASSSNFYQVAPESPAVETDVKAFWMDRYPVTNAMFYELIKATGYLKEGSDVEKQNFLKHWVDGKPPKGRENHPVVYVSYDDAVAYAKWRGMRLPTEEEWQYAAGASDGRSYPWSDELDGSKYNSKGESTTPVDAHPSGASPFGVEDMVGNVWQWTASLMSADKHEVVFVRGGCWFDWAVRRFGDQRNWWVKGGPRKINDHHPLPLFGPGMNRFSTVGFRCVKDE